MKAHRSYSPDELRYLKMLSRQYPTLRAAGTEIINLQAILNLPKGCEHFISDVHGEHEAFLHLLNSCSGVIRLLPRGKACPAPPRDRRPRRMVPHHALPPDRGLPFGQLALFALEGPEGPAAGLCLYHRRASAYPFGRDRQARLLQKHHQHHRRDRAGPRLYRGHLRGHQKPGR